MKEVIEFLEKNGFKQDEVWVYKNGKCFVFIMPTHYEVVARIFGEVGSWYSKDLTIYTLIGYLTYYGLMDKNYKQA